MMPDLGKYAVAVLSSYGVTLALLAGLVGLTLLRGARVRRQLDAVEQRRGEKQRGDNGQT
ncbi:MAG: heme exporter protein CcmD [Confluentimicrobium sp.]|uniref:heme exporter protein CcmD n=1 Tax=Actibacterium sp. TaxID=1872125 RepID=UPI000C360BA1|nr:heme exporter protein CcmD [Actibacterium sp.]MBC57465.1 heme exporter protein CcmD [Actibacterium sp.]|tara:strand:+ start:1009 stop:1188 length:180 start_codon:yes stop_codon:yes gene_type:complete